MHELIEFLEKRGLKEEVNNLKKGKLNLNYKHIGIEGASLVVKVLEILLLNFVSMVSMERVI